MRPAQLPFVDWLKCLGILLIVTGHVAARPFNHLAPPIYPKQLGVALFLFVLGFGLANETRARRAVLFNRLFDLYLYALPLALIISAFAPLRHSLNLSNYLPFLFGANVLFNNFPANPTTWFVGTYLHVLVVWAVAPRFAVRGWMVAVSFVLEVAVRAALATTAGPYVAYMALFNWSTVFLSGMWWGQRLQARGWPHAGRARRTRWTSLAALAAFVTAWASFMPAAVASWTFPFARLSAGSASVAATSAGVSTAYLAGTWLCFQAARGFAAPMVVRFFARNTLFVFLAHMPVFYLLEWVLAPYGLPYTWYALINMAVCFLGLSLLAEGLGRAIRPRELRARAAAWVFGGGAAGRPAVAPAEVQAN